MSNASDARREKRWLRIHQADPGRDEWLQGYAAALAAVNRLHHVPTIVESVLDGDGLTLSHLRAAGVESFDLKEIRAAFAHRKAPR